MTPDSTNSATAFSMQLEHRLTSKDNSLRLTETLKYIGDLDAGLRQHLEQVLAGQPHSDRVIADVSAAISLAGLRPWYKGMISNNTPSQRDALRALLLCQRVYLTNLWSARLGDAPQTPGNNWPKPAVDHWKFKSELDIRDGIRMYFPLPNIAEGALVNAAAVRSAEPDSAITAKRNSPTPMVGNSCFDQVSHWLLAAGHVSLRWLVRYAPQGFNFAAFGAGRFHIQPTAQTPAAPFTGIAPGLIVRMYTDRRPGGHFMVSDKGGWGWGYNNAALEAGEGEGQVTNGHTRCLLHRQFNQYRQPSDVVSPFNYGGQMVLLDPAGLTDVC